MNPPPSPEEIVQYLQQGMTVQEINALVSQKQKKRSRSQYWEPQHGWLTSVELRNLEQNRPVYTTQDERLRGYRLTAEKFKEICDELTRKRTQGSKS